MPWLYCNQLRHIILTVLSLAAVVLSVPYPGILGLYDIRMHALLWLLAIFYSW